jgi:predicted flavoprotein YhiN
MPEPILTRAARVAVMGGGPGGLMAAEVLARAGATVTVYERMPSVGRKLLLAGRGGLNLTHSEPVADLLDRYGPARDVIGPAVGEFGPAELRAWCAGLGEQTFVGTSGRVFPESFRATPLLRSWLRRLDELGVTIAVRHTWRGWADPVGSSSAGSGPQVDGSPAVVLADRDGVERVELVDAAVLALGGASWPRVGSDGGWVRVVEEAGIRVDPLRPANVGVVVPWSRTFSERFAGTPLKNVRVSAGNAADGATARGDAMVTRTGLEGGVVYAVGRALREELDRNRDVGPTAETGVGPDLDAPSHPSDPSRRSAPTRSPPVLAVDLLPDLDVGAVIDRLGRRRSGDSQSTALRRALGLTPVAVGLLREATGNRLPTGADDLAHLVKAVPVTVTGLQPIDRAISTAGGIALDEIDEAFMLRRRPGTFVAGEMLDWEAPTGGYLLQATFSSAVAAARGALVWLRGEAPC